MIRSLEQTQNELGFLCLNACFTGIIVKTVIGLMEELKKQMFSNFYLTGILSALESISRDSFILYVGYTHGDMQIGVTGSCLRNEHPKTAALREIKEELGIDVDSSYLIEASHGKMEGGKGYSTIFSLCLDVCHFSLVRSTASKAIGADDKRAKIAVIIYGSAMKMNELLRVAKPLDGDEKINYYASVPQEYAYQVTSAIKNLKKSKKRKNKRSKNDPDLIDWVIL